MSTNLLMNGTSPSPTDLNGLQFNSNKLLGRKKLKLPLNTNNSPGFYGNGKDHEDNDGKHLLYGYCNQTRPVIVASKSAQSTPINRRTPNFNHLKHNNNNNVIQNAKSATELTRNSSSSRLMKKAQMQANEQSSCDNTSTLRDVPSSSKSLAMRMNGFSDNMYDLNSPSQHLRYLNSARYQKSLQECSTNPGSASASVIGVNHHSFFGRPGSDTGSHVSRTCTDIGSDRSWASVGMGSTDGRKMIVRRVPTSPVELFNIVNPPTPPEEYLYDDSFDGSEEGDNTFVRRKRPQWANKLQFVLACIGYSVGLGSVWRFPYLCYKSGGGVFLIPYLITMFICGVPMLYMELAIGQFTGRGPIGALGHLCPIFKGTGVASVVISFIMSTYYCVIIAHGIYYFFTSFKPNPPWSDCSNLWNTPNCWNPQVNMTKPYHSKTPAEEFYDQKVLQVSKGIEDFGPLRWELVACLLCAWILVYFALWKSIKSSAKVRYVTATFPFLLIIILMANAVSLEGAYVGLRYFFRPDWRLLGDAKVWVNAVAQTFNSMGIAFGSMICFASYNKFNNNILHDTLAVSFVNVLTSLLVGILAFATIGNIAHEQNKEIEDVIADGPGLIFVVYPEAMAKMPAPHVWSLLFFFMLLCLALNSQFAIVEVVVTSIQDGFPSWIKKRLLCHEVLVLIVCVVSFFLGFPNITKGGIYFFQLIDHYAASISIMYIAFMEFIAVAWFYGVWRLSRNIKEMTGRAPSLYFKFCWIVAAPLLLFSVWVFYMIAYEQPSYDNGNYQYPAWALAIGWVITSISILCIPLFVVVNFCKAKGANWREKLCTIIRPNIFECPKCKQHHCEHFDQALESEPMLDIVQTSYHPNGIPRGLMMSPGGHNTAPSSPHAGRQMGANSTLNHPISTIKTPTNGIQLMQAAPSGTSESDESSRN